ncbi:molybdopterin synthase sulfur carrier subunit [Haloplanus vescus]|uniref:Molybdopterin synthase sulfur carrier subunit n=1 Tax=Haloplanus vescus TaxID=555874 RepID=A0A1H3X5Z0_9EURY|nr:ubiquitin-like small modifier protein 1 [Haloplanus vescus]SDZ94670.1 molybdopterin synthase sulfur carrier subunit [Haloplanus vescus]
MHLNLRFFATFREAVGQKTLEHEFEDGATVGNVLSTLESEYEGLEGQILTEDGDLQPNLNILKNGREVLHMEGTETLMEDDDTLSIFPPVAGGA